MKGRLSRQCPENQADLLPNSVISSQCNDETYLLPEDISHYSLCSCRRGVTEYLDRLVRRLRRDSPVGRHNRPDNLQHTTS